MNRKNLLIVSLTLPLMFIVSRMDGTSSIAAFGLISLAQVALTILFIVGIVRLAGPSLRLLKIDAREPRKLIWGGLAVLAVSPVWLFGTVAVFATHTSVLGITSEGRALVVILPTLFLAGTGLSMIAYGFILRYIASDPGA